MLNQNSHSLFFPHLKKRKKKKSMYQAGEFPVHIHISIFFSREKLLGEQTSDTFLRTITRCVLRGVGIIMDQVWCTSGTLKEFHPELVGVLNVIRVQQV